MTPDIRWQLFPLFRVAVMLALGIASGDAVHAVVSAVTWGVATLVVLCAAFLLSERPVMHSVAIMSATFFLGAWLVSANVSSSGVVLPDGRQSYEAVVAGSPSVRGKVVVCDLIVTNGPLSGRKVRAAIHSDTSDRRHLWLRPGIGLKAESAFERPVGHRADGGFDYSRWMQIQGYAARTFVWHDRWTPCEVSLSALSRLARARLSALKFRERLLERYRESGGGDYAYAVVAAMTLGDKSALSGELKEVYSVAGASHVLALSGLHLGIIYVILSTLFCRRRWRLPGQTAIVVAMWAYAFMVGLSPSVVRAAAMFSVYAMASLANRERMSLNTLSVAAVAMLVVNPLCLWDVGFQMSFAAMASIFVFYPPIYHAVNGGRHLRRAPFRWLWGMTAVSLAAQLGVAPLVMYYFGRFSCYFLLTNIVAIPLATAIVYGGFFMLAAGPVPLLQGLLADALFAVASWLNAILTVVSGLPGASIDRISINGVQLMLIYVFLGCLYGLGGYVVRMRRSAAHTWK